MERETRLLAINCSGSAGAMEPFGTLALFQRSVDHNLRYKYLISDGDSKTFSLLCREKVYGGEPDDQVAKLDCVGHVQKRLGTALRSLKTQYKGQKLSDGKTIGGAGRLTDSMINSLQNYYGKAIRNNTGNLELMVRAVQATLLHSNSSDETPRHHLCPTGEGSWCKWQRAQSLGIEYTHRKPLIPEAIVYLLKPIYARLGSPALLEKCLEGYTPDTRMQMNHCTQQSGSCVQKNSFSESGVLISPAALQFLATMTGRVPFSPSLRRLNLVHQVSADIYLERKIDAMYRSLSISQVSTEKP